MGKEILILAKFSWARNFEGKRKEGVPFGKK